jgi:hypothetical protein
LRAYFARRDVRRLHAAATRLVEVRCVVAAADVHEDAAGKLTWPSLSASTRAELAHLLADVPSLHARGPAESHEKEPDMTITLDDLLARNIPKAVASNALGPLQRTTPERAEAVIDHLSAAFDPVRLALSTPVVRRDRKPENVIPQADADAALLAQAARLTGLRDVTATQLASAHADLAAADARSPEELAADRRDAAFASMAGVDLATFRAASEALAALPPAERARTSIEALASIAPTRRAELGGDPFTPAGRKAYGYDDADPSADPDESTPGDDKTDTIPPELEHAFKLARFAQPQLQRATFMRMHRELAANGGVCTS